MTFLQLAKFEFLYFFRQPSFYVTSSVCFLLTFFAMISDNVQIGGAANIHFNSPQAIAQTMLIMNLAVGLFVLANFIGNAATRDFTHKMDGIVLAMPLSKSSYLWARLAGAYAFCLLVFALVPLGTLAGSFWPTVDPERLGDTDLSAYLWIYTIFIIPNFAFLAALFYILARKTRSMLALYVGVIGFFVLYSAAGEILGNPNYAQLAALLDPFGLSAFSQMTQYWTPFEHNHHLVPLSGVLLSNRLIWLALSAALIVATHIFMDPRKPRRQKQKKQNTEDQAPTEFSSVKPTKGGNADWQRFVARTTFEIARIIKSAPFIVLCAFSLFSLASSVIFQSHGMYGTNNWPLTRDMVSIIRNSLSLMVLIVTTYYAAELVWQERQNGIGDIIEATPIKNWTLYFPKLLALAVVIISIVFATVIFTASYQLTKSYTYFEWGVYAGLLTITFVLPALMNAVLAITIQVLSPNKYVGMLILVGYFIVSMVLSELGLEHHMWHFATAPGFNYSDINGYGHFLQARFWYTTYSAALSIVMVVLAYGLWPRGSEYSLRYRLSQFARNIGSIGKTLIGVGLTAFLLIGANIYYNTRIINEFISDDAALMRRATYEKKFRRFEDLPVPTIIDVFAAVDFYPQERRLEVKGYYNIVNHNALPLTKVLLNWNATSIKELSLHCTRAEETDRKDKLGSTWLLFNPPLQAKEGTRVEFTLRRANQGFVDRDSDTGLVANGSFVNSFEIFPHFGYNARNEIENPHKRRKRGLPPPRRAYKLEDKAHYGSSFVGGDADFINFETIVSTSHEQLALAPGYLQRKWVEGGRNYYHYKMDAPIINFVAYLSGVYTITKDMHHGIPIEVFHAPHHNKNVRRMIEAVKSSLDYFGAQFSPYQYRQVRIIEFPRYEKFAQSFSNTIPYSEDIGFVADLRPKNAIDYVYFVTAHELAHQWWAHQVLGARVQGGDLLTETLAQYSAFMVMEKHLGKNQLRKFLKWEMDRYLKGRSQEIVEEQPLYKTESQPYIHYRKGGVVMYALRDRIGEEAVNTALRKFLQAFQYAADPYPTSLDLLKFIRAESGEENTDFIDDMFLKITIFDLKVKSAEAQKLENGSYKLSLVVEAHKFYADGQGEQTVAELDDSFDIGIFSADPDSAEGSEHVLYLEKRHIEQGENKFTITVQGLPKFAGIDPYVKMIDRNSDDNLRKVLIH